MSLHLAATEPLHGLKRLKTDWIDLYQYHLVDPLTPIEETLRALDDLVHQGTLHRLQPHAGLAGG